jgi:hypothetical protein
MVDVEARNPGNEFTELQPRLAALSKILSGNDTSQTKHATKSSTVHRARFF